MYHETPATERAALPQPVRSNRPPLIEVRGVSFWYGDKQALVDVDLDVYPNEVLAFMGPSGCGKTTLIKLFNRMQEELRNTRMTGSITFDGEDIFADTVDPPLLRRRFGWVAQKPNPFPKSIRENIAYGPRIHALIEEGAAMDAHVRDCLDRAHLWHEVHDRLHEEATRLSGGQQQRLCIARALAVMPDFLLMDEPCSSIDPIATEAIEGLIRELSRRTAIVIITHNLTQARRISDRVAFFKLGRVLEVGPTEQVFTAPMHPETKAYLSGRYG